MAVGDKQWALNQLRHARNSYLFTLAGLRLLNSPAVLDLRHRLIVLTPNEIVWDPDNSDRLGARSEFHLDQLINDYENARVNYDASLLELYKFVRRNLVTESFEVTRTYAVKVGISSKWRAEPWHQVARIVRNAIAHDFTISFDKHAKAALPITWAGKTIDLTMEGSEVTNGLLDPVFTVSLISGMQDFVERN